MKAKTFSVKIKHKIKPFNKIIHVDSDKSLSIRSFLIGAICQNVSTAKNILESEDVHSTITACRKLGVKIIKIKKGNYKIFGKGLGSLLATRNMKIDFGNSGTLARLLIGILSTTPNIEINISGDNSLNKRSMKKIINLMSEFGAFFLPKRKYNFPLKMISSQMPVGINYSAGVSAQLKSAVILAGLNSYGKTQIFEKVKSRDHTENLLRKNTDVITVKDGINKKEISVIGKKYLNSFNVNISGDPSSSAFFAALTLLNKNSKITIRNVGLNPTRIGFYQLLKKQNARVKFINIKKENNEVKGDIIVKSCKLKPIYSPSYIYPSTADEYPILFVVAALTNGISVFKGIGDLANKESNRIKEMQKILAQIGIKTKSTKDEIKIFGKGMINASNKKIKVPSILDHRIAMSAFILGTLTNAETSIKNFATVFTSSPSFLKIMKSLGAKFEIQN